MITQNTPVIMMFCFLEMSSCSYIIQYKLFLKGKKFTTMFTTITTKTATDDKIMKQSVLIEGKLSLLKIISEVRPRVEKQPNIAIKMQKLQVIKVLLRVRESDIIDPRAIYLALEISLISESGNTIVLITTIGTIALKKVNSPSTVPIEELGTPIDQKLLIAPMLIIIIPNIQPFSQKTFGNVSTPVPIAEAHKENMLPLRLPESILDKFLCIKDLLLSATHECLKSLTYNSKIIE
eukprot:403347581